MTAVRNMGDMVFDALKVGDRLESDVADDFQVNLATEEISTPEEPMNRSEWLAFCEAVGVVIGERKFVCHARRFIWLRRRLDDMRLDLGNVVPQVISSTEFTVPRRFILKDAVGMGQYGIVCSGTENDEPIAMKRIENVFESLQTAQRTLRELKLLRLLKGHDNILNLQHAFIADSLGTFNEVYLITELFQQDLASILHRADLKTMLTPDHSQFLLYQLLRGMKYVHSAKVIHRDLKPRNLLISQNWDLIICDFGLARRQMDKAAKDEGLTCYICSRWYRAPEALCCWPNYTVKLDMWGIGCIWGEILSYGTIIFQGKSTQDVIQLIGKVLGAPNAKWIEKVTVEKCRALLEVLPDASSITDPWGVFFDKDTSDDSIQVMRRLCRWDPDERISCEECLALPFFGSMACLEDEPKYEGPDLSDLPDFEFEQHILTDFHLRIELFLEVLLYFPKERDEKLAQGLRACYDVNSLDRKSSKTCSGVINKSVTSHMMSGMVWKLNSDGDPAVLEHWLERKMWLTKNGGLFYYSKKHDAPIGRSVRELHVAVAEDSDKYARPFVFQLAPNFPGGAITTLGASSIEERDAWVEHLNKFEEDAPMFRNDLYKQQGGKRKRNIFAAPTTEAKSPMGKMRLMRLRTRSESIEERSSDSSLSPTSRQRRDSQLHFTSPDQTAMVFDWDDTLFPTTWIREDMNLNWRTSLEWQLEDGPRKRDIQQKLNNLSSHVITLLRSTKILANVVVITLAKSPWVEISSKNFMPDLWPELQRLGIPVVYAQAVADEQKQTAYNRAEFKSANEVERHWTGVKAEAISREVERFYSRYPGQSWKNILSCGDSDFERKATQQSVRRYWAKELGVDFDSDDTSITMEATVDDHYKKVRVKTFKLLDEPTVEELLAQVQMMRMWMKYFIQRDRGVDIVLEDSSTDERIHQIHRKLTGHEPPDSLSWVQLGEL